MRVVAWIPLSTFELIENNDTIKTEIAIVRKGVRVSRLGYPLHESVYGFLRACMEGIRKLDILRIHSDAPPTIHLTALHLTMRLEADYSR